MCAAHHRDPSALLKGEAGWGSNSAGGRPVLAKLVRPVTHGANHEKAASDRVVAGPCILARRARLCARRRTPFRFRPSRYARRAACRREPQYRRPPRFARPVVSTGGAGEQHAGLIAAVRTGRMVRSRASTDARGRAIALRDRHRSLNIRTLKVRKLRPRPRVGGCSSA